MQNISNISNISISENIHPYLKIFTSCAMPGLQLCLNSQVNFFQSQIGARSDLSPRRALLAYASGHESGVGGQGAGLRDQGAGCRCQGAGVRVQGSGCRVQVAGLRVQGSR